MAACKRGGAPSLVLRCARKRGGAREYDWFISMHKGGGALGPHPILQCIIGLVYAAL